MNVLKTNITVTFKKMFVHWPSTSLVCNAGHRVFPPGVLLLLIMFLKGRSWITGNRLVFSSFGINMRNMSRSKDVAPLFTMPMSGRRRPVSGWSSPFLAGLPFIF